MAILSQPSGPRPWWQVGGFVMRKMLTADAQILQSRNWEKNLILKGKHICVCVLSFFNKWNLSFLIQLANIIERFKGFLSLYSIISVYEVNSFVETLEVSIIISTNVKVRFKHKWVCYVSCISVHILWLKKNSAHIRQTWKSGSCYKTPRQCNYPFCIDILLKFP